MHTLFVFSDTHGTQLPDPVLQIAEESDKVVFLGDGLNRLGDILLHKGFIGVTGNCDWTTRGFNREEVLELDGVRMLLTHGHDYRVKSGLLDVTMRAKELNCSVVFYGHTHFAAADEYDGVLLICPGAIESGALTPPSYVYAVTANGKLTFKHVTL